MSHHAALIALYSRGDASVRGYAKPLQPQAKGVQS